MSWGAVISIFISVVALILSLYTYFKHDAIIKNQEKQINEFQLLKLKKEAKLDKQAIINANIIKTESGRRIIKVYNRGRFIAENVMIIIRENHKSFRVTENPSPIDILPQASVEVKISTFYNRGNKLEIEFQWKDGLRDNNKVIQTLQI